MTKEYAIVVVALPKRDGGGYAGIVPDLPGCMSDGATQEEAVRNAKAAIADWLAVAKRTKMKIPAPGTAVKIMRDKEKLVREALAKFGDLRAQIEEITLQIRDLKEDRSNAEAWARFAEITKLQAAPTRMKEAHC